MRKAAGAVITIRTPLRGSRVDKVVPVASTAEAELDVAAAGPVVVLVDHADFPFDRIARSARLVLDAKGVLRSYSFGGETL